MASKNGKIRHPYTEGGGPYKKKSGKKTVKVSGKKTTIGNPEGTHVTIQGPSTLKTDLKGGALDEVVAPIVKDVKKVGGKMIEKAKGGIKRVKESVGKAIKGAKSKAKAKEETRVRKFVPGTGKIQVRKYWNNKYEEGK